MHFCLILELGTCSFQAMRLELCRIYISAWQGGPSFSSGKVHVLSLELEGLVSKPVRGQLKNKDEFWTPNSIEHPSFLHPTFDRSFTPRYSQNTLHHLLLFAAGVMYGFPGTMCRVTSVIKSPTSDVWSPLWLRPARAAQLGGRLASHVKATERNGRKKGDHLERSPNDTSGSPGRTQRRISWIRLDSSRSQGIYIYNLSCSL